MSDKAALYLRLSKEDENSGSNESESIQNQKLLLVDYAIAQGWQIYKIYSDDDYSGLDANRPEFLKMINDASLGKFNVILCKTISRFTRDMELVEKYIHGKFVEWGIRFIGVVDNTDTNIRGGKKARQIYGLVKSSFY